MELISVMSYLKNPIGYKPVREGTYTLLEVGEVRTQATALYKRQVIHLIFIVI